MVSGPRGNRARLTRFLPWGWSVDILHLHHQIAPLALVFDVVFQALIICDGEPFDRRGFAGGLIQPIGFGLQRLINRFCKQSGYPRKLAFRINQGLQPVTVFWVGIRIRLVSLTFRLRSGPKVRRSSDSCPSQAQSCGRNHIGSNPSREICRLFRGFDPVARRAGPEFGVMS